MIRLSTAFCSLLLSFPVFLAAKGLQLSSGELAKEVAAINKILRDEHAKKKITPPQKLSNDLLIRRIYLATAGRIPSYPEIKEVYPNYKSELKQGLIDQLLESKAYQSQMFNWWADHLRAKTYVTGQANQIGLGFLYVDWLKSEVAKNVHFDELARSVITAEGYPWEDGAVGYYVRDDGMPLENMSNTAELFLGTQMVCAQCHDHPFDKWTQMEYYQMASHTYGIITRMQGERIGKIQKLVKDRQKEMNSMQMSSMSGKGNSKEARAFRQATADMLLPLQIGTKYQNRKLKLPHDYKYDDAKPKQVVKPGVIFDSPAPDDSSLEVNPVTQYANWMTSPENPRFTRVIANRMWKKIFGRGLVEPMNDWKDDTLASIPELLDYLTELMVRLDYDLREFQRVLLNLEIFEREAYNQEIEPLAPYSFPAPVLTRMSSEQLWDSVLAIMVPDVDNRALQSDKEYIDLKKETFKKYRQKIESLSTENLVKFVRKGLSLNQELQEQMNDLNSKIKEALATDDRQNLGNLKKQLNQLRDQQRSSTANLIMGENFNTLPMYKNSMPKSKKPLTQEQKRYPEYLRRASEIGSPAYADHFLREFGQSDRNLLDNSKKEASVPQALNLLNTRMRGMLTSHQSVLTQEVLSKKTVNEKIEAIYLGLLQRHPTKEEIKICLETFMLPDPPILKNQDSNNSKLAKKSLKQFSHYNKVYLAKVHGELRHLTWALINTREFSFIQ